LSRQIYGQMEDKYVIKHFDKFDTKNKVADRFSLKNKFRWLQIQANPDIIECGLIVRHVLFKLKQFICKMEAGKENNKQSWPCE